MADWYTQRGYWLSSMLIKVLLKECFEASLFLAVGMRKLCNSGDALLTTAVFRLCYSKFLLFGFSDGVRGYEFWEEMLTQG